MSEQIDSLYGAVEHRIKHYKSYGENHECSECLPALPCGLRPVPMPDLCGKPDELRNIESPLDVANVFTEHRPVG